MDESRVLGGLRADVIERREERGFLVSDKLGEARGPDEQTVGRRRLPRRSARIMSQSPGAKTDHTHSPPQAQILAFGVALILWVRAYNHRCVQPGYAGPLELSFGDGIGDGPSSQPGGFWADLVSSPFAHVLGSGLRVKSDGTRTRDRLDHNQELYQVRCPHQGRSSRSV